MGPGIGPWVGTINRASEYFFMHMCEQFFATCVTPTPPSFVQYARSLQGHGQRKQTVAYGGNILD